YDDIAVGQRDRLAAQPGVAAAGRERRAPAGAAVGGGPHPDRVTGAGDVVFGVAVAEVRAGAGVVADGPVLVVRAGGDGDGITPGQAAVGGAADEHVHGRAPDAQGRDHPDV